MRQVLVAAVPDNPSSSRALEFVWQASCPPSHNPPHCLRIMIQAWLH